MAEIDASIPANAGHPQFNPLQTLGTAAGVIGQMNQNKLFQQQFQSNQAASRLFKEAVDPVTGKLDPAKFNQLLQSDPSMSLGAATAASQAQGLATQQVQIQEHQLALARAHYDAMGGILSSMRALPDDQLNLKNIYQKAGDMVTQGLATWDQLIPELKLMQDNPQSIRTQLTQLQLSVMDANSRLNAISPAAGAVNTGATTQFVRTPQIGQPTVAGGGAVPATGLANTLPPTTQEIPDKSTTPTFLGGTQPTTGLESPTGGGAPPGPPSPTGGQPAPTGAPGTIHAGLPVGASEALADTGHASAQQGVALQQASDRVPAMRAALGNMDSLLGKFTPGPGSHSWKEMQAGLNMVLQSMGFKGPGAGNIASQEDFDKQAAMVAGEQFNMLGGTGTDAKLDAARTVSPNSYLSGQGNHKIIGLLKGNADALQAKARAWNVWSKEHGPQTYGDFSTDFNNTYDPRVFQFQYLSNDERKDALDHMSLAERQQFVRSYNVAIERKWVPSPKKP